MSTLFLFAISLAWVSGHAGSHEGGTDGGHDVFVVEGTTCRPLSPDEIQPIQFFVSDACSGFLDGVPSPLGSGEEWKACCVEHDKAYWRGGTADDRIRADKNLENCIQDAGYGTLADMMFLGVRLGGHPIVGKIRGRGFGWSLGSDYRELTVLDEVRLQKILAQWIDIYHSAQDAQFIEITNQSTRHP